MEIEYQQRRMMEKRKTSRLQIQPLDVESREDDVDVESSGVIEKKRADHMRKISTVLTVGMFLLFFAVFYFRGSPRTLHTLEHDMEVLEHEENAPKIDILPPMEPKIETELVQPKTDSMASDLSMNNLNDLQSEVNKLIEELRTMKRSGTVMEEDETAKAKISELQGKLRQLVPLLYGPEPYIIEMTLTFPKTMPDYETAGPEGIITFELGPLALVPYSSYYFLEIVKNWKVIVLRYDCSYFTFSIQSVNC